MADRFYRTLFSRPFNLTLEEPTFIQWNPSCEATPFASEKWPFKRGGLLSWVKINTFMFIFTLPSGLSREGGLSSGWPLKRGSTVLHSCIYRGTHMLLGILFIVYADKITIQRVVTVLSIYIESKKVSHNILFPKKPQ